MTEHEATGGVTDERAAIADALVRALDRRHEILDAVVDSEDYDAAIEAIADLLETPQVAAEAVLRLSFDRPVADPDRCRALARGGPPADAAPVHRRHRPRHLRRAHRGHQAGR